ncbi:O-antigen ligase family protein [Candidatus Uhrbacteria bacterium]|nr:O-antigen ligase family protein [Candidatus Uhrbacteria bacterium]
MVEPTLIVFFFIAFGVYATAYFRSAVLLFVFALPLYVVRFSLGPFPSTIVEGMIVILAATWIIEMSRSKRWGEYRESLTRGVARKVALACMGLFFAAGTVSVFVSPAPLSALGLWRAYFVEPILLFFIMIDFLRAPSTRRAVITSAVASAVSIACVAIVQRITGVGIPIEWAAETRVTSIYPYPNAVGLYVAPLIPLAVALFLSAQSRVWRVAYGAAVSALIAAIFFAQTEAALGALFISLFLFALFWRARSRLAALSVAALVIVGLVASPAALSFFTQKVFLKDWSGKVRRGIWIETRAMLKDHWVFGAGLAGYKEIFPYYHTRDYIEVFQYPHSIVLNFWTETGIAGTIGFAFLVGMFFFFSLAMLRRSRLLPRSDEAIAARAVSLALITSMTTILLHGLVDVPYFKNDLSMQFWLLNAIAWIGYGIPSDNAAA